MTIIINPGRILHKCIHYLLIYTLVLLNGAMLFVQNQNVILWGVIILYGLCCLIMPVFIKREAIFLCLFLFLSVSFVRTVSGGIGIDLWVLYAGQILIGYICLMFDRQNFVDRFVKTILWLAVASLICWTVLIINRSLLEQILRAENAYLVTDGRLFRFRGQLFYTLPMHVQHFRNTGIFSEPGRYQAILHGGLFCCLFLRERIWMHSKTLILTVTILIITILTTQSTTGYIGLIIILAGFMLKSSHEVFNNRLKKRILIVMFVVLTMMLADYLINDDHSLLSKVVLSKLEDTDITEETSSGGARLRMIVNSLQIIADRPWGAGTFDVTGNIAAGGLIRFIAILGIVPGAVMLIWIFKPLLRSQRTFIDFLVFLGVYVNIALGQTYAFYPGLLVITLAYGHSLSCVTEKGAQG